MPRTVSKNRKPKETRKGKMTIAKLEHMIAEMGMGTHAKPVQVKRTIVGSYRNGSAAVSSAYSLYFTLNDLFDVSELTSSFDIYRFRSVKVEFRSTTPAVPPAATPPNCYLMAAIDLDDGTTPTLASLSQYENSKVALGHQSLNFSFEPRFAEAGDAGGNYLVSLNMPGKWIDCAYPAVVHRGLKYFISQASAASVPAWQIIIKYHLEFARQR